MQEVKRFVCGHDLSTGAYDQTTIEDQVNKFLKENPTYILKSMIVIVGTGYKEAFAIFDIKNEPEAKRKNNKTSEV